MNILAPVPVKRGEVAFGSLKIGPIYKDSLISGAQVKRKKIYEDVLDFWRGIEKWLNLAGVPVIRGPSY